jgi:guanine deaminase
MITLRARIVSPVTPDEVSFLPDAKVVVDGPVIHSVSPWDGGECDEDIRDGVLTPGFVDAHVHFPQTRIVGAATGPLLDWLARSTFPEESRFADNDHAHRVAEVFAASLAAAGTTLPFVYGPVFPSASDALFRVLHARGQRAIVGPVWMDEPNPNGLTLSPEASEAGIRQLHHDWHGKDGLEVAVIPRFGLSCSMAAMQRASAVAGELDLWQSTHLSENLVECELTCVRFGTGDYLRVYEDAGMLVRKSVYAHCIHLSDAEWDRFAASGAVVAHCPDSNFFLGSGRMPIDAVRRRGIPVAIGTDIAAGRTFRVPRTLSSAYDSALCLGTMLDPRWLLWAGTRGGAVALQASTGAVEPGLDADLVLHDVPPWAESVDQILASILFDHDAPRPRRTWVRGREVWRRPGPAFPY